VQLPPTVLRRLAALVYESLLVGALLFFGAAVAHGASAAGPGRIATQAFLWILLGAYFVVSWRRGGRTLALKAWQLRVVDAQGAAVSLPRALLRYVVAALVYGAAVVGAVAGYRNGWTFGVWAALVPAALSVAYGFLDEQGRFLHDRLTGTKIVHEKPLVSRG
jgi:uncharacterized RDD family membrane protein YckC